MGGSIGRGFGQQRYPSPSAFYGEDEQAPKPKFAPGAGGRPAVPGGPMLPRNPYAEFAWERQRHRSTGRQAPSIRVNWSAAEFPVTYYGGARNGLALRSSFCRYHHYPQNSTRDRSLPQIPR
jgi:hypothetical protein